MEQKPDARKPRVDYDIQHQDFDKLPKPEVYHAQIANLVASAESKHKAGEHERETAGAALVFDSLE